VKIRGVRVEPEEVEAVLKKYMLLAAEAGGGGAGVDMEAASSLRAALREASVVASAEPSELVAFVSQREGVEAATVEGLRAHCQAHLTPSYVPKFFVILPELPKLPNGKPNLSELKKLATAHAAEEAEVVMDSLGQMKKLSKWAIFENAVIHRCYAFWMVGVLTDHWMRCAIDSLDDGFAPFCTVLSRSSVKPWTEILVRTTFGNDQDMFGFIMLGAYQDARPDRPNGPPRVKLGLKDLFVFLVYMCMALPIPQLMHYIFQSWAWPVYWGQDDGVMVGPPSSMWDYRYMQYNSLTSDHRWYLIMVLEARIFLQICETARCPGWLQVIIYGLTCAVPNAWLENGMYAFDVCEYTSAPSYVLYTFSWIFRNFGGDDGGCAIYYRWVQIYGWFYVVCFHFLRPFVSWSQAKVPQRFKTPTWGAVCFSCAMMIGVLMGLFHYPNNVLENGTHFEWAWLEIGVDFIQPTLIVIGMSWLPVNLAWWGNTTLGCYVFHFYFKDQVGMWAMQLCDLVKGDDTGLLAVILVFALCFFFTTVLGPAGHFLLLSPTFLYARLAKALAARRAARARRVQPPREVASQCRAA